MIATASAAPPLPSVPPSAPELELARASLATAKATSERTAARVAAASQAVQAARADMEALDLDAKGYPAAVHALEDAKALQAALAGRQEQAAREVVAATSLVAWQYEEATRARVRELDAAIKSKGLALDARAREVGAELAAEVNALKDLVTKANELARTLPEWKPSSNEVLCLGPDDRGSFWAAAPHPAVSASPVSALLSAASVAGVTP